MVILSHGGNSTINDWVPFPEWKEVNIYCFLKGILELNEPLLCDRCREGYTVMPRKNIRRLFFPSWAGGSDKLQKVRWGTYELQATTEARPRRCQNSQTWKGRCLRISKISILGLWKPWPLLWMSHCTSSDILPTSPSSPLDVINSSQDVEMQKGSVVITRANRKVVAWTRIDISIVIFLVLSQAKGVPDHVHIPGSRQADRVGREGSLHTQDKTRSGRSHGLSSACSRANPCQIPTIYWLLSDSSVK